MGLLGILAAHFGIVLFTILSALLVLYLAYSMLRPERF
ncbi:MAG: potassium-transporting ATPase subunit F [Thermoplasmata archaeon]